MNSPNGKPPLALPEGYADWLAQLKGQIAQAWHCSKGQFGQQPAAQLPWFHVVTILLRLFSGQLPLSQDPTHS